MTTDELKALLAGATSGPWHKDGPMWNQIVWTDNENRVCFMAHSNGLDDARDDATARLIAAAPDLAAEVIRLREALPDPSPADLLREAARLIVAKWDADTASGLVYGPNEFAVLLRKLTGEA